MPEFTLTDAPADLPDHDLLRRFVLDTDEAAFAEIVRRHQRLVMGICRRITADQADAEDAFQAVFLALARRPRSIRRAASLSGWLYTVACRTSHRLVRQRRIRPVESLEQPIPSNDRDPLEQIAAEQNADVLHSELNLLPERYRQVLVMTYFAQQTSQQIADQLQLTKGTVDGRIRQARNTLRVRLARRGISLSVLTAVAVSLQSSDVVAAATPGLLESTICLGSQTMTNSLPGTVDLSRLEPLLRTEIAVMKWNVVTAVGVCAAFVVGLAGMAQVGDEAANSPDAVTAVIDTIADVADEPVADRDASNLSDNNLTRFLSVSFVLKVDPGIAELTRQRLDSEYVQLKDWLGAQIADKSLDDVSGKAGQDVLRNEIREQFSQVLFPDGDNEIDGVYFTEFAVQ